MRTVCGKFLVLVAGMAVADLSSAKDLVATNDFQAAIDAVAAAGGGTVRVPAGEYVTGGVQTPIVVRLGARHEPPSDRATRLENILIENVTGTCVGRIASSVTGVLGGRRPSGITLRNVDLTMPGGATEAMNFRRRVAEELDHAQGSEGNCSRRQSRRILRG